MLFLCSYGVGDTSVINRKYVLVVLVMYRRCFGDMLVIRILAMPWVRAGNVLVRIWRW